MMPELPELFPGHKHEWTDYVHGHDCKLLVTCTVCGFTVPRSVANLDGQPAERPCIAGDAHDCPAGQHDWYPDYDSDRPAGWYCRNCDAYTYPTAHPAAQPTDQPEQETT